LHQSSTTEPDGFVRHNFGLGSVPLTDIVNSAVATAKKENSDVVYISPDFDFEASNRMRTSARYPINDAVAPGTDIRTVQSYVMGPIVFDVNPDRKQTIATPRKSGIILPSDIGNYR